MIDGFCIQPSVPQPELIHGAGVHPASAQNLVLLLSKDFIKLMIIASVITIPLVYFLMEHVLENTQHYSVQIGFVEIVASLLIMMLFVLTTILSLRKSGSVCLSVGGLFFIFYFFSSGLIITVNILKNK